MTATRTRTRKPVVQAADPIEENTVNEQTDQADLDRAAAEGMTEPEQTEQSDQDWIDELQTEVDEAAEADETVVENTEVDETATDHVEVETKLAPISPVTPFQAAKRVNAALAAAGVDRKIQAPMLYTYAAKKYFATHQALKVTKKGVKKSVLEIDEESFLTWMEKYIAGATGRASDKRVEQVEVAEGDESVTDREMEAEAAEAE
jgi:hypothetical protein